MTQPVNPRQPISETEELIPRKNFIELVLPHGALRPVIERNHPTIDCLNARTVCDRSKNKGWITTDAKRLFEERLSAEEFSRVDWWSRQRVLGSVYRHGLPPACIAEMLKVAKE